MKNKGSNAAPDLLHYAKTTNLGEYHFSTYLFLRFPLPVVNANGMAVVAVVVEDTGGWGGGVLSE